MSTQDKVDKLIVSTLVGIRRILNDNEHWPFGDSEEENIISETLDDTDVDLAYFDMFLQEGWDSLKQMIDSAAAAYQDVAKFDGCADGKMTDRHGSYAIIQSMLNTLREVIND